jgi:radical SAM superfamily enzyme YgiQ (UPF0313 family)
MNHCREKVKCFDLNLQSLGGIIESCKAWIPDVIGFNVTTITKENVLASCKEIKKHFPKTPIILGGAGAKVEYQELLKNESINLCFIANIEQIGSKEQELILEDLYFLPGVAYIKDGELIINSTKSLDGIDWFQFPNRELDGINYRQYLPSEVLDHPATILTSRGCPYRCTYCASLADKVRMRSVENVVTELDYLRNLGHNTFIFEDYEMLVDLERTRNICDDLGKNCSTWVLKTRVEKITDETAKMLAESGCLMVYLGVETLTQKAIWGANKFNITQESVMNAITHLKNNGIKICVSIQFGLPGDTEESFEENTACFLRGLLDPAVDMVQLHFTTLFPGTKLHKLYQDGGVYVNIHQGLPEVVAHGLEGLVMPHLNEAVITRVYRRTHELLGDLLSEKAIWSQNKK